MTITVHRPHLEVVILTQITRGAGTKDDCCRRVVQVYSLTGDLIAEEDPFIKETPHD
ncbi:MAG TPA: hypothetical protein VMW24_23720 [Sedimentisphaerales bacterium]|nr:hypothetical protein [Sedimentisphaerales bacterium]